MEAYRAAFRDLSEYLEREPDAPEFEEIRARVMDLRTLCGRLN